MKEWKESLAHIVVMQMLVTVMLVERWTSED